MEPKIKIPLSKSNNPLRSRRVDEKAALINDNEGPVGGPYSNDTYRYVICGKYMEDDPWYDPW